MYTFKQRLRVLRLLCILLLLLAFETVVAVSISNKQKNEVVGMSSLLIAEADAVGVRRNTNVRQDAIDIVRLDSQNAVLLQEAPQNRKNNIARVIRLSDGCELREKLIVLHALNDGGFDTVDAMQTYGGHLVTFAGTNAEIVVWDLDTDEVKYLTKKLEDTRVDKLEFTSDGRLIVAGRGLQVWDLSNGALVFDRPKAGPFAVDRKGNIVVATDEGFDELDRHTYDVVRHISYPFALDRGSGIMQTPVQMTELSAGLVFEQAYTGQIRLWDFDRHSTTIAMRPVWEIPAFSDGRWNLNVTYDPDGYVIASDGGILKVFSAATGRLHSTIKAVNDSRGNFFGFVPLPRLQLATFQENDIAVWNLVNGRLLKRFQNLPANYSREGKLQVCLASQDSPP